MLKIIIEKCSNLEMCEKRASTDDYYEAVFFTKDTGELEKKLSEILGDPVKPPETKLTKEDANLADSYGGVRSGQTLFRKKIEDHTTIVILWPWQDGVHTTLKAALVRGQ